MYFPENIDSKIDFRPYSFENYLQNINMYFEIKLEAKEYPVIIVADLSNFKNSKYPLTRIYLLDSNCLVKEDIFMGYFLDQDTLFVFKNNTKNTIISCFEHEFSVKDFKPIEPTWEIFPNPVNQAVTIEGLEALNGKIELIDLSGKMLNSFELNGSNSMIINIGSIPKGTYFIRCLDETKEEISIRKLIVE
jgi:hypothetical protein